MIIGTEGRDNHKACNYDPSNEGDDSCQCFHDVSTSRFTIILLKSPWAQPSCGSATVSSCLKRPRSLKVASTAFAALQNTMSASTMFFPPSIIFSCAAIVIPNATVAAMRRIIAAVRLRPHRSQAAPTVYMETSTIVSPMSKPELGYCVAIQIPTTPWSTAMKKNAAEVSLIVFNASSRVLIALNQFDFDFCGPDPASSAMEFLCCISGDLYCRACAATVRAGCGGGADQG